MEKGKFLLLFLIFSTSIPVFSVVIHVPGDYPTIQEGIDAAVDGDTVLVADGIYLGMSNRDISFKGKVIIVRSENGSENCIIDCEGSPSDPHRGFNFHSREGQNSILQGFTIRNGHVESSSTNEFNGGGIKCTQSSPTIKNNIIIWNTAGDGMIGYGGGIYCEMASPTIINNIIRANEGTFGGGIHCNHNASPLIFNNTISHNRSHSGGGIECDWSSTPTISNNIISENEVGEYGWGGGIYCSDGSPVITNNLVFRNTSDRGGGIFCSYASPLIENNTISENTGRISGGGIECARSSLPEIVNNTISGNISAEGGGIYISETSPNITHNTIAGNQSIYGSMCGGGIYCSYSSAQISDNIISNNEAIEKGGGIFCFSASPDIINNTLSGNTTDEGGGVFCLNASPMIRNNNITGNCGEYGAGILCSTNSAPTINKNNIFGNVGNWSGGGIGCESFSSPIISNNFITRNEAYEGGGIYFHMSSVKIINNTIHANSADYAGGGIDGVRSSAMIADNTISGNISNRWGGGIADWSNTSTTIINNHITQNSARDIGGGGGGILCYGTSAIIKDNLISKNTTDYVGGGIYCDEASPLIQNSVLTENEAGQGVGGIYCSFSDAIITNVTMAGNRSQGAGGGIRCVDSSVTLRNSILWDDTPDEIHSVGSELIVVYCDVEGGYSGEGNINADPLFVPGPFSLYYLSHIDTGQNEDSPCMDSGDPKSEMIHGTTRTDSYQDTQAIDIGYHHPLLALVTGPGPGTMNMPKVRAYPPKQNSNYEFEFDAYAYNQYGVNLYCGDVDGDGLDEVITGASSGEGHGPHVRGFHLMGELISGLNFMAYGTLNYGVHVATGDINQDGFDEIITGIGPGLHFGPHVRAFSYDQEAEWISPIPGVNFMAYSTRHWGVNVACGDIDGDGYDEIITGPGPGPGFGPHVRGWDVDAVSAASISNVNFCAYGTKRYGLVVACGDVDGDGIDEILTAPGPGGFFGAHIRGWNYDNVSISTLPGCSFFAWPSYQARYGARLFSGVDLNIDVSGRNEFFVGPGPDPTAGAKIKAFMYDGNSVIEWFSLWAYDSSWTYGANVAAGRF